MRKKGCLLLAALALLLAGCGEKTQKSAEDLQARYAQMQGYEAIVETAVPREDETLHYTLSLEHSNGETRAAVLAPEELTGVGAVLEGDNVEEVFFDPRHPYTWALLSSLPQLGIKGQELYYITGTPPSLYNQIKGDAFAPRNEHALKIDFEMEPPFFPVSETHYAKTWLLDPRAPKLEKPEIIQDLHEKIKKMTDKGGAFHVE